MTLPGFHECPTCHGRGYVNVGPYNEPPTCRECGGAGQVPDDDTVELMVRVLYGDHVIDHDGSDWFVSRQQYHFEQVRAALLAYARHTQVLDTPVTE